MLKAIVTMGTKEDDSMTRANHDLETELDKLSHRELGVIELAAQGLTDDGIARDLGISRYTVTTYWSRIRAKIGSYSRAELAIAVSMRGLRLLLDGELLKSSIAKDGEAREKVRAERAEAEVLFGQSQLAEAAKFLAAEKERNRAAEIGMQQRYDDFVRQQGDGTAARRIRRSVAINGEVCRTIGLITRTLASVAGLEEDSPRFQSRMKRSARLIAHAQELCNLQRHHVHHGMDGAHHKDGASRVHKDGVASKNGS